MQRIEGADADLGGVDDARARVIRGLLRVDPTTRWTLAELDRDLNPVALPEPIESAAPPISAPPPVADSWAADSPRIARRRYGIVAAVVAVLVIAGIAVLAIMRGSSTPSAEGQATATPASSTQSAAASPTASSSASAPASTATTRVVYRSTDIPSHVYTDSLDWVADVCVSDAEVATPKKTAAVGLFKYTGGKWVKQSVTASAAKGGRCGAKAVNVTVPQTAEAPEASRVGQGWGPCTKYRLVIPETSSFAATNIYFCVQTKLDEA
jgi:hypothetical protein